MSRIGKNPITIPAGVDVVEKDRTVTVTGPKGELSFDIPGAIEFSIADGVAEVTRAGDQPKVRSLHGLTRSLIANIVEGVTAGFKKELQIQGVGYRAALKGKNIEVQVGFSHPVIVEAPDGITFEVPEQTRINVLGIDKQLVGQVAADIRKFRKPEPYKGKGVMYTGEVIRRKAGKTGK